MGVGINGKCCDITERQPDIKCLLLKEQNVTSGFAKRVDTELENASISMYLFAQHTEDREMG